MRVFFIFFFLTLRILQAGGHYGKEFLESKGLSLLSHWDKDGAFFIKTAYLFNQSTLEYLKTHHITNEYKTYYEPFFRTYYHLNDADDSIKKILKQGLAYEGNIGRIIYDLVRLGSHAIDIGSHIGVHTVTMSKKVGPHGAVFSFEPNRQFYLELLDTLNLNQCENVIPICKALSDHQGEAVLSTSFHHCPQVIDLEDPFSLCFHSNEEISGDSVEVISLDSLDINNVSLIKIDVETYEYFVLKGAKDTILKNKPVIIFECWTGEEYSDPKFEGNFDRVMTLMESYDYEVYLFHNCDFIAFPKGKDPYLDLFKKRYKKLDSNSFRGV